MLDDPIEELTEVYNEVKTIESQFKQALGIARHLLGHSRKLFNENRDLNEQIDEIKNEN